MVIRNGLQSFETMSAKRSLLLGKIQFHRENALVIVLTDRVQGFWHEENTLRFDPF